MSRPSGTDPSAGHASAGAPTVVVTYHTNPFTCGVARFNALLGRSLGIPVTDFGALAEPEGLPLLSIKASELDDVARAALGAFAERGTPYWVLLHGWTDTVLEATFVARAGRVCAASAEIAALVRPMRPDVVAAFAPGAPVAEDPGPCDVRLMTFGMAHKIDASRYAALGRLVRADGRSFRLDVSTAIHEGANFDEGMFSVRGEVAAAFGGGVSFLGFLADGEVSRRLRECDALVAFFPGGVRENNTTVMSAMAHGCAVITNLDPLTPPFMVHDRTVFDVHRLEHFPSGPDLRRVGTAARKAVGPYDFASLASLIRGGSA